jgi:alpha-ribazole phosphatase
MRFGSFENRNFRDLEADPAYAAWVASGCELPCPGGESREEFTRRCRETFLAIVRSGRDAGAESLHFVVHGGTIMAVMSGFATPERDYFAWRAGFCGGYVLESIAGSREQFSQLDTL